LGEENGKPELNDRKKPQRTDSFLLRLSQIQFKYPVKGEAEHPQREGRKDINEKEVEKRSRSFFGEFTANSERQGSPERKRDEIQKKTDEE